MMKFIPLILCAVLITPYDTMAFAPSAHGISRRRVKSLQLSNNGKKDDSKATTTKSTPSSVPSGIKYSGAGEVVVDMNQYNLPMERIVEEWTANLTPANDFVDAGVFLGAANHKDIMVDTVKVSFPRRPDSGLGIVLQEIAGGRDDGLGITIVSGLVEGGASEGCGILEGDSISKIAIQKRVKNDETNTNTDTDTINEGEDLRIELDEEQAISTECLGYDATVNAIMSLPPAAAAEGEDEVFVLSVKRLRRRPRVSVTIQYPPSSQGDDNESTVIQLFSGENLRRAMLTRGVKLNDALARRFDNGGSGDCGAEGTCATCAVSILKGGELLNPQGIQEQQMLQDNPRWRLGCRAIVGYGFQEGEMILRINPKQWAE